MKNTCLSLLLVLAVFSCKKHEDSFNQGSPEQGSSETNINAIVKLGVMVFNDSKSFQDVYDMISKNETQVLHEWAVKNNFVSFADLSESIYEEAIKIDNLNSLQSFIDKNNNYIFINKINGDEYLETRLKSKLFKTICNKDRLFIIGDKICKVTDDYLISSSQSTLDEMKKMADATVPSNDKRFLVNKYRNNTMIKTGCGGYDVDEALDTGGSYSVKTEIEILSYQLMFPYYPNTQCIDVEQTTTNYKKFLGIWFKNSANLSNFGYFKVRYYFNGSYNDCEYTNMGAYIYNKELVTLVRVATLAGYDQNFLCYFVEYTAYGYSDEVDRSPATVACN